MLGSKEAKDIYVFLTRGRHRNLNIHYISQSWYGLPKKTFRNNCSRIMFFPKTLKDISMIYNDISGLQMNGETFAERCGRKHNIIFKSIKIKIKVICIDLKVYQV